MSSYPSGTSVIAHLKLLAVRPVARFVLELLAMCGVMCMGGAAVNAAIFTAAGAAGQPDLVERAPIVAIILVAVGLTIPMAAYMRLRGHGLRHNAEMVLGTWVIAGFTAVAVSIDAISASSFTTWATVFGVVCGPACALMGAQMLLSYRMYTGHPMTH